MRRNNLTLALAVFFCLVAVGFGGDDLKSLCTDSTPAQTSALASPLPAAAGSTVPVSLEPQRDPQSVTVYITRTGERYHWGTASTFGAARYPFRWPIKVCRPSRQTCPS